MLFRRLLKNFLLEFIANLETKFFISFFRKAVSVFCFSLHYLIIAYFVYFLRGTIIPTNFLFSGVFREATPLTTHTTKSSLLFTTDYGPGSDPVRGGQVQTRRYTQSGVQCLEGLCRFETHWQGKLYL